MNPSLYRKIYYGSALAGFVIIILFPGEIFGFLFDFINSLIDLFIELCHYLFEVLLELGHVLIELIESALDHLIEHLFHTGLQATQTIVFYIMLLPGIYIGYLLLRALISFSRRCVDNLLNAFSQSKARTVSYWHSVDSADKIKWAAIFGACLYLIFLVSF